MEPLGQVLCIAWHADDNVRARESVRDDDVRVLNKTSDQRTPLAQIHSHHHQEKQRNQCYVEVTVGDRIEIDYRKKMNSVTLHDMVKNAHRVDLTVVTEEIHKCQPREEMDRQRRSNEYH